MIYNIYNINWSLVSVDINWSLLSIDINWSLQNTIPSDNKVANNKLRLPQTSYSHVMWICKNSLIS